MAAPIERVVDAHIHLWDPANVEWYPYLAGQRELDMGDISGMCRLFDQPTYFAESSNWNVVKFVHVAAATAPYSRRPATPTRSSVASCPAIRSPTSSACSTSRWSRRASAASGPWVAAWAFRPPRSCAPSPSAT